MKKALILVLLLAACTGQPEQPQEPAAEDFRPAQPEPSLPPGEYEPDLMEAQDTGILVEDADDADTAFAVYARKHNITYSDYDVEETEQGYIVTYRHRTGVSAVAVDNQGRVSELLGAI